MKIWRNEDNHLRSLDSIFSPTAGIVICGWWSYCGLQIWSYLILEGPPWFLIKHIRAYFHFHFEFNMYVWFMHSINFYVSYSLWNCSSILSETFSMQWKWECELQQSISNNIQTMCISCTAWETRCHTQYVYNMHIGYHMDFVEQMWKIFTFWNTNKVI